MGLDNEDIVFLTQDEQELHMLQHLQTQSRESFDYKQGYDYAIFEVHKQYNMRSKKNTDTPDQTKKTMPNQPRKIKVAPITKTLQILPRPNQNPPGPTIVDIIPNQPPNDQPSTSIPFKETLEKSPNTILENPHKKTPNTEKEGKPTSIPAMKIPSPHTENSLCLSIWDQRQLN